MTDNYTIEMALLESVFNADFDLVKTLIESGVDINARNHEGKTSLALSIQIGARDIAEFLLKKNADKWLADYEGFTPLMRAAEIGNNDLVSLLMEGNHYVNAVNACGVTALMVASSNGHIETVKLLVENNAHINAFDKDYRTPLKYAASSGHTDIVKYLIEKGADINKTQDTFRPDETALMCSVKYGKQETFRFLLDAGANAKECDGNKKCAFHWACESYEAAVFLEINENEFSKLIESYLKWKQEHINSFILLYKLGQIKKEIFEEMIELLLEKEEFCNWGDSQGMTPLMKIVSSPVLVEKFIGYGADVNERDNSGYTALNYACQYGPQQSVRILIQKGADVNRKENGHYVTYFSPLFNAIDSGVGEKVKILLDAGAKVFVGDNENDNLINRAGNLDIETVSALLKAAGGQCPKKRALQRFAMFNGPEIIKALLEGGYSPDACSGNGGVTALMTAVHFGRQELAEKLIESGADPKKKYYGDRTMLMFLALELHTTKISAIESIKNPGFETATTNEVYLAYGLYMMRYAAITKLLVEKGVDINAADIDGWTALMYLCRNEVPFFVNLFFSLGAKLDEADMKGTTAMMISAQKNYISNLKQLIRLGANVNLQNKDGETALSFACRKGYYLAAKTLIRSGAKIETQDKYGLTPFHRAVISGNLKLIKLLLNKKANFRSADARGRTALMFAAEFGRPEVVKLLISICENLNIQDKEGMTALTIACEEKNEEAAELIIDAGADVSVKDIYDFSVFMRSLSGGMKKILRMISEKGNEQDIEGPEILKSLIYADSKKIALIADYFRYFSRYEVKNGKY